MLEVRNISKQFGQIKAVDNITFAANDGEITGILGPNGAGKTTTMRMIAALLEPDSGEIKFAGENIVDRPASIRDKLGYLLENNPLYLDMLTSEFLDFVAGSRGLRGEEKIAALKQVVKETAIEDVYYQPLQELSKGFRQRVGLAQAILHKPQLLILDEPTEGLDPNQRVEIRELIRSIGKERTVLLSTHVLSEVKSTCDRVIIIHQGRIVADGSVEELIDNWHGKRVVNLGVLDLADKEQLLMVPGVKQVDLKDKDGKKYLYQLQVDEDEQAEDIRLTIFNWAKDKGWRLFELHQQEANLEDVFRDLTKGD